MTAQQIYQAFDLAGLTPDIHWLAAPIEWRTVCEAIAEEQDNEIEHMLFLAEINEIPKGKNSLDFLRSLEPNEV